MTVTKKQNSDTDNFIIPQINVKNFKPLQNPKVKVISK